MSILVDGSISAIPLALLALPAAAAVQDSDLTPPPDRVLLDTFQASCTRVADAAAMRADAIAAGWLEIAEDTDPRLGRLLREGRANFPQDARGTASAFRASATSNLFLTQTRLENGADWRNTCRIYQFDAAAPIDPVLVVQWIGRPPTATDEYSGASRRTWDPGWGTGMTIEIAHIPASLASEAGGVSGNVLIARAVGSLSR